MTPKDDNNHKKKVFPYTQKCQVFRRKAIEHAVKQSREIREDIIRNLLTRLLDQDEIEIEAVIDNLMLAKGYYIGKIEIAHHINHDIETLNKFYDKDIDAYVVPSEEYQKLKDKYDPRGKLDSDLKLSVDSKMW
jgi:hypothetical protein